MHAFTRRSLITSTALVAVTVPLIGLSQARANVLSPVLEPLAEGSMKAIIDLLMGHRAEKHTSDLMEFFDPEYDREISTMSTHRVPRVESFAFSDHGLRAYCGCENHLLVGYLIHKNNDSGYVGHVSQNDAQALALRLGIEALHASKDTEFASMDADDKAEALFPKEVLARKNPFDHTFGTATGALRVRPHPYIAGRGTATACDDSGKIIGEANFKVV